MTLRRAALYTTTIGSPATSQSAHGRSRRACPASASPSGVRDAVSRLGHCLFARAPKLAVLPPWERLSHSAMSAGPTVPTPARAAGMCMASSAWGAETSPMPTTRAIPAGTVKRECARLNGPWYLCARPRLLPWRVASLLLRQPCGRWCRDSPGRRTCSKGWLRK